jgi:hypothetical protein
MAYSIFADQLVAKAHSNPTPSSQPPLLLDALTDAPVVRLVTVAVFGTQPPFVLCDVDDEMRENSASLRCFLSWCVARVEKTVTSNCHCIAAAGRALSAR